jgi:hypothetical protein
MYAADHDERLPLSVRPLIAEKRIDPAICLSPADPYPQGFLAFKRTLSMQSSIWRGPKTEKNPRCTYVGPGDYFWSWSSFTERILQGRNPGWLVNFARAKHEPACDFPLGVYQRLLVDGAVVTRRAGYWTVVAEDGIVDTRVRVLGTYFNDEDAKWFDER